MKALRIAALAALCGCNHHVFSPPARSLPLESMATVGHGRTGLAVEAARHAVEPVFSYSVESGTARFRHGVAEDVDLSLEGNIMHVEGDSAADTDPDIYTLRIGTKYQAGSAFAVTGGYGFGMHAAGTFMSPDIGMITGWENRYAVPFFAARMLLSIPVRKHEIDTTSVGSPPGTHVGTPRTAFGLGSILGLRIPIPASFEPKVGVRGSVIGGVGTLLLADRHDDAVVLSAGGGGEIEF